jgi:anti-sigma B factor antagonist
MAAVIRKHGDIVIVDVDGRLALGGPVDEFRAKWTEALGAGAKELVINLTKVTMVDSSGIGTMIRAHSAIKANGGTLKVVGANTTVRQAFHVTRLDKVFEFHENEESALGTV